MTPLIDADILLHEIGWSSEFKSKETGEDILLDWPHTQELLDNKIKLICEEVGATLPPILFITNDRILHKMLDRVYFRGETEFQPNFRFEVAVTKPYKGTRESKKPYHFYNLMSYIAFGPYDVRIATGMEADDLMGLYEPKDENEEFIYCSRDKDIRQFAGWHFSWECGKQRAIGPVFTDKLGWLELKENGKDVLGYGDKFLYYQLLTGDAVDNIPGCPGIGAAKAYEALKDCQSDVELFNTCMSIYDERLGHLNDSEGYAYVNDYWEEQFALICIMRSNKGHNK